MSVKTIVLAALAAFSVSIPSALAGVISDTEVTNAWFTVDVSGLSSPSGAAVPISTTDRWTAPTAGEAFATNHQYVVFDTEVTDPLVYTPAGVSGATALVNVHLSVEPNTELPAPSELGSALASAQAALTVVTNTTMNLLEWVGLARDGSTNAWMRLAGDTPVAGAEYDVQIAVENGSSHKIRYSVKGSGDSGYKILTSGGVAWFNNPKGTEETHVSAVAFAGAGKFGDFSGKTVVDDTVTIDELANASIGFDFTNGTVQATLGGNYEGKTVSLSVVNFADGDSSTLTPASTSSGSYTWNLDSLMPGGTYSYTLTVSAAGGAVRAVKSGTFTAANWNGSCWFSAKVVGGVADITNGTWSAEAAPTINTVSNHWDVSGDAVFNVADKTKGSNHVVKVDTKYAFSTFSDVESLEALTDVLGGIVAVSDNGGAWCAYALTNGNAAGWIALTGGVAPVVDAQYVIRAEFDFMSASGLRRMRYLVSGDNGASFSPLATAAGKQWLTLAEDRGTLSSVGMSGRGYVKSIEAAVSDKAVAEVGGVKYNTLVEALNAAGNGATVTLLTNVTFDPAGLDGSIRSFTLTGGFTATMRDSSGKWKDNGDGTYSRKASGTTYIFF